MKHKIKIKSNHQIFGLIGIIAIIAIIGIILFAQPNNDTNDNPIQSLNNTENIINDLTNDTNETNNEQNDDNNEPKTIEKNVTLTIETNKDSYKSSQTLETIITLNSNTIIQSATVTCTGIKNRFKFTETINLDLDETTLKTSYKLPKCNVCGGISEGDYDIVCELVSGDYSVTGTKTIEINQ